MKCKIRTKLKNIVIELKKHFKMVGKRDLHGTNIETTNKM